MSVVSTRPFPADVRPRETAGLVAAGIAVAPFAIAAIGVATAMAGHDEWFSVEDGPAENTQFALLVAASAIAARVAYLRRRREERLLAVMYAGLAAALFVLAGEEISWGQRLFDIATPAVLAERNIQQELNLHNTNLMNHVLALAQLVLGFVAGIVPFVRWPQALAARHGSLLAAVVPPPVLAPYFLMTGAWRAYRWTADPSAAPVWAAEYGEVVELVLYLGLFLFGVGQLRAVSPLVRR